MGIADALPGGGGVVEQPARSKKTKARNPARRLGMGSGCDAFNYIQSARN